MFAFGHKGCCVSCPGFRPHRPARQFCRPFQDVFQFPSASRPSVAAQRLALVDGKLCFTAVVFCKEGALGSWDLGGDDRCGDLAVGDFALGPALGPPPLTV